jgi:hypothetical protein
LPSQEGGFFIGKIYFSTNGVFCSGSRQKDMKQCLIVIVVAIGVLAKCFSSPLPDDPRLFTAIIMGDKKTGSGCIVQLSNSVYLVTARHVLFSNPEGTNALHLVSDSVNIKTYGKSANGTCEIAFTLGLAQMMTSGEVRYSSNHDIAMVRLAGPQSTNQDGLEILPGLAFSTTNTELSISPQRMMSRIGDVDVGSEVWMLGYPVSITGPLAQILDPTEPLLRKGIVAGVNVKKNVVVIDSPSYFGNSGGPVLELVDRDLLKKEFKIIGLVSWFVPFQEEWENKTMGYSHTLTSNSGYTILEPMDTVLDMAWR